MQLFLIILAGIWGSGMIVVARGILSAPRGHQDSQGFHAVVTPTAAEDDSHLAYSEAHACFWI
jgi:hypothetical protein